MKNWEEGLNSMDIEQLKSICKKFLLQNQQLTAALHQERNKTFFKRMDYLFKVVEIGIFPEEFTQNCMQEIQEAMVIEEPKEEAQPTTDSVED